MTILKLSKNIDWTDCLVKTIKHFEEWPIVPNMTLRLTDWLTGVLKLSQIWFCFSIGQTTWEITLPDWNSWLPGYYNKPSFFICHWPIGHFYPGRPPTGNRECMWVHHSQLFVGNSISTFATEILSVDSLIIFRFETAGWLAVTLYKSLLNELSIRSHFGNWLSKSNY